MAKRSLEERLWSKVTKTDGCWLWTGALNTDGYGVVWIDEKSRAGRAHRVVYELLVGPIPPHTGLDHLCRNRACVRPDHLEPVSTRVNVLRGVGITAVNSSKTACVNGHPFTLENTYPQRGSDRACRTCRAAAQRRYMARERGQ